MRLLNGDLYINACDENNKPIKDTDLERNHWFSTIENFVVIESPQAYYVPVPDQPTKLVKKESYVKRVYRVKAPVCQFCKIALEKESIKSAGDRLRVMSAKVGLAHRCFMGWLHGSDYTEIYQNSDNYYLISETLVNKEEIFKLYLEDKVDWIRDYAICQMIEERLGINL